MKSFIGIDPSFSGFGYSRLDPQNKIIIFDEFSVDVKHGAFAEISKASLDMIKNIEHYVKIDVDTIIGMEIPPVSGLYAVKLWALDSQIYNYFKTYTKNIWLFNVPYLKFIHGKVNSKKDTMEMINSILKVFKEYDYTILQHLKDKRGKDRKLTSNQCDSFLYCIRVFIKDSMKNGTNADIVSEILNINERFLEEKETDIGKKL